MENHQENCNDCQFSNEDDLCDKGHKERQSGNARYATECLDFKLVRETQTITTKDVGSLEDILGI